MTGPRSNLMLRKKCPFMACLPAAVIPCFWTTSSCKKIITRTVVDIFRHAWQPVTYFNSYGQPALNSAAWETASWWWRAAAW